MKRRFLLVTTITLFACLVALGQQQRNKLAEAQQENARALRQYNWKSRTEVRKGGETKSTKLYLTRYAADGTLQQTLISESSQSIPKFGLRGMIARKKKDDFVELLGELGALAKSYGNLAPDRMQQFMAGATVTPEGGAQARLLRIHGRDVLRPGDSMTVWVDAATRRQRRVEVLTTFDEKPLSIVSDFRDLP
ncbi:MAG TPA: hypothetical protein VJT74_08865, partial [Pyrinomonadaceae bacterium]|nr:hypothetical protein [Pyrinomonadaceae bacterium]